MSHISWWYNLEKKGWSWAVGHNIDYGGYYAQAWRRRPRPVRIDGYLSYRECFTEGGKTIAEAELKLWQRLKQLEQEKQDAPG